MTAPLNPSGQGSPTRPYLIRALHDWCVDNGFTPYLAVYVDESVRVPTEYVKNREIVLNVSFDATSGLTLGNEFIEFKARFGGVARDILVPVDHVVAIYARENGQGMAFPVPLPVAVEGPSSPSSGRPGDPGSDSVVSSSVVPLPGASGRPAGRKPRRVDDTAAASDKPARAPRAPKAPAASPAGGTPPPAPPKGGRPALKRVK